MDYFLWQPAPNVPAVRIAWPVVEGIEAQVLEGFKALPKRGAEVGGALLGRRDPQSGNFTIDGFEAIPIEYATGPSYVLSDPDLALWREKVAELRERAPGFIGIYRSQTRPGLSVMPEDCAMVERLLPREEGVLLLTKPLGAAECVGAVFLCDGGAVLDEAVEARQFPLRKPERAPRVRRKTAAWIPLTAALVGIAVAVYLHNRSDRVPENPSENPSENPVALPAPSLGLRAEANGSNARIAWDPASALLDGATGATLNVADGDAHRTLRLTAADLRNGYVEWPVRSRFIDFEVQVERPGQRAAAQSIRWENPGYPINSSSDKPIPKPSPLAAASPQTAEDDQPVANFPQARAGAGRSLATKTQASSGQTPPAGRMKRIVNGITSKASHLWPFHSAKPEQQTR